MLNNDAARPAFHEGGDKSHRGRKPIGLNGRKKFVTNIKLRGKKKTGLESHQMPPENRRKKKLEMSGTQGSPSFAKLSSSGFSQLERQKVPRGGQNWGGGRSGG